MARKKSNLGKEIAAGNQPMFMTPGEVVKHYRLGDSYMVDEPLKRGPKSPAQKADDEDTLQYKLHDSKNPQSYDGQSSLYESIKKHGVQNPIFVSKSPYIGKPLVMDGHHRLAVSRHLNPKQFVPVEYN